MSSQKNLRKRVFPQKVYCPRCSSVDGIVKFGRTPKGQRYRCNDCKRTFTATSLSLFQSTHKPSNSSSDIGKFYITGKCNVGGSILSLIHGSDYLTERTTYPEGHVFRYLFDVNSLDVVYNKIINAKDLIFPEYTSYACYAQMFENCYDLRTAPRLPAKKVTGMCYAYMFNNCTSLTKAPSLLALSHKGESTYKSMFSGCSNLSYIKMMSLSPLEGGTYGSNTQWVKNVSPTGTYIANYKCNISTSRGENYIPAG